MLHVFSAKDWEENLNLVAISLSIMSILDVYKILQVRIGSGEMFYFMCDMMADSSETCDFWTFIYLLLQVYHHSDRILLFFS